MDVNKVSKIAPLSGAGGESARPGASSAGSSSTPRSAGSGSQGGSTSASAPASSDSTTPQSGAAGGEPTSGGILASSGAESGRTREAADPRQSPDRQPDAEEVTARLRERFAALAAEARLPTNARLAIDYDAESDSARFRVVNKESGDVIREIPERDFVDLLRRVEGRSGLVDDEF